jgi:excisionase family DNA binding protein
MVRRQDKVDNNSPLLRSKDVAHILDCSPDEVVDLARGKKLKATKQGRLWRFRRTDVMAYKRQNSKQP